MKEDPAASYKRKGTVIVNYEDYLKKGFTLHRIGGRRDARQLLCQRCVARRSDSGFVLRCVSFQRRTERSVCRKDVVGVGGRTQSLRLVSRDGVIDLCKEIALFVFRFLFCFSVRKCVIDMLSNLAMQRLRLYISTPVLAKVQPNLCFRLCCTCTIHRYTELSELNSIIRTRVACRWTRSSRWSTCRKCDK